jgi:hypothetical protein
MKSDRLSINFQPNQFSAEPAKNAKGHQVSITWALPPLAAQRASAEGRRQESSTWTKLFHCTPRFFSRGSFGYWG